MRFNKDFVILVMIGLSLMMPFARAKRSPPPHVDPVVVNEITYSVEAFKAHSWQLWPVWKCDLVATKEGKEIWRKESYSTALNPLKEQDVQEVYPKSLVVTMHKIPDKLGVYHIKGIDVVDEANHYHYVAVED